MKHKHHIIPKHMGGTDDPENIIELTVKEHAEAHRLLYEKHERWQDYLAWKGLLGLITEEERMRIMYDARKGEGNFFYGKQHSEETKKKISEANKGRLKGIKQTDEHIEKRIPWKGDGSKNPMYGKSPWNKGKKIGPQSADVRRKKGKPLIFNGIEYNSLNEAEKLTGISSYKIGKACKFL